MELGRAREVVAHQLGFPDWDTAAAALTPQGPSSAPAVPVVRIQDERLARTFYLDYLDFRVEWEHRFGDDFPLYMRIRRGRTVLDLSEHHGDGTPGTAVWIAVDDVAALHTELTGRAHPRAHPGIDRDAPGGPTLEVIDPWGNALRFCQPR